ncbi:hypothetical protein DFH28DRAFT_1081765 [Melampsora americana]|nr:hypothetical protein DFH28DRAFT_1081765 [Melampsora americana]
MAPTTRAQRILPQRGLPASRGRGSNARGRKTMTVNRPLPSGRIKAEDQAPNNPNNPKVNPKRTCRLPVTRATEGRETDLPDDFPTFQNYLQLAKAWPIGRCKELMNSRRHLTVSRASVEAIAELKLARRKFQWSICMISMISNITIPTAKKELKLIDSSENPTNGYDRWRSYGKLCLEQPMTKNRQSQPLVSRNVIVGTEWSNLNADEKAVFGAPLFFALAGLPDYSDMKTGNGQNQSTSATTPNGPTVHKLNEREEARYRPIFERLVDMERVTAKQGEAFDEADHRRKALHALEKVHHHIATASDKHDWAYYFLAASAHQSSKGGKLGWSKFFTSHPAAGDYVEREADFASTFSAYVQGLSAKDRMERYSSSDKKNKATRVQAPSDRVKIDLGNTLVDMLTAVLGQKPTLGFPRGENPNDVLKTRRIPAKLVQHPGHALPAALLSAGFNKMNADGRLLWQEDIKNGLFTIEATELEPLTRSQNKKCANPKKKFKSKEFVDSGSESENQEEEIMRLAQEADKDDEEEEEEDIHEDEDE